jgi:DNA-binding NarL/FixJ family response regulator
LIRVLVADDQQLQRLAFRMLVECEPGMTVAGEAGDGAEAVRQAAALGPDVVVMDARMPGTDGIEATRQIVASGSRSRVLVVTGFDLDEYAYAGLRAGASGFLPKDAAPEELIAGIRAVVAGDAAVSPGLVRRMLDAGAYDVLAPGVLPADPRLRVLSGRERQVLAAIGRGLTNAEIAQDLVLAESTVKKHVRRVLEKAGARDRVQAVIFAYDTGLAGPRAGAGTKTYSSPSRPISP